MPDKKDDKAAKEAVQEKTAAKPPAQGLKAAVATKALKPTGKDAKEAVEKSDEGPRKPPKGPVMMKTGMKK